MFVRFFLFLSATALTLLAGELIVRQLVPAPPVVSLEQIKNTLSGEPKDIELRKSLNTEANELYVQTPAGRRLRPNTHAVVLNHETCHCTADIRTNSLGFRGREIGQKNRPRVLFLGDSITFADYVPEPESWVRRIESLSEAAGQEPIETINAGIWAVGLANELSILIDPGLKAQPDVVVLGFYLNDVENSPGLRYQPPPPYLGWSRGAQLLYRSLGRSAPQSDYGSVSDSQFKRWKFEAERMFPVPAAGPRNEREAFNKGISDLFFDWGSSFSQSAWVHMEPMFSELKRLANEHHFRLAIVVFPVANQVYTKELFDFPQRKIREIAAALNVPLLDILPFLRSLPPTASQRLFYDWCHYTPEGNEMVARWVYDFLRKDVLSPSQHP